VRLSLGGVRDEAEIRGHRRTYVGALPGKIIQSLKRVEFNNPLFCLDEIDKMSMDFRGDPSSALLEVLDPEQNNTFNDHYLDMDYDLSKVFFITTANSLHTIPLPLQDRMEIIKLPGYLETEKEKIARNFLLPKKTGEHGLKPENMTLTDDGVLEIIRSYTREAGVRNLEREIATICRKVARRIVEEDDLDMTVTVDADNLPEFLGIKKHRHGEKEERPQVGVTTGLAWTEMGGELLVVETVLMPGTGKVEITGKLGEVMQESAKAALSYVRSRSGLFGLKPDFHKDVDVHVHVPEGATPKDGPSAGITLTTAIVSALLGVPVRDDLAMTGEITLRGRVLPIGGLREKLLAAHRGLITKVLIPKENLKDLEDVPKEILDSLEITPVEHMDEVLRKALACDDPDRVFCGRDDYEPLFQSLLKDEYKVEANHTHQ
jgi:ATP-dependent Lon protease